MSFISGSHDFGGKSLRDILQCSPNKISPVKADNILLYPYYTLWDKELVESHPEIYLYSQAVVAHSWPELILDKLAKFKNDNIKMRTINKIRPNQSFSDLFTLFTSHCLFLLNISCTNTRRSTSRAYHEEYQHKFIICISWWVFIDKFSKPDLFSPITRHDCALVVRTLPENSYPTLVRPSTGFTEGVIDANCWQTSHHET